MRDRSPVSADAQAELSSPAPSARLQPHDDQAQADLAEAGQAGPGLAPPDQAEPVPAELVQANLGPSELGQAEPGQTENSQAEDGPSAPVPSGRRSALRRAAAALAWTLGGAAIFVLFLRITRTRGVNSDAANNALQAYDMLHGHLLLHGWIIGDATYYTFDLPVIALVEVFFGVHTITMNVAEALIYLIVAAWAVAIAVTGSRGAARAARAAVVIFVLAAPALIASDMWIPLGIPDHTGTTVFLLVPCLLIDRLPTRRFTAPLLCVLLCAGQIGDVTVRYVAVPAIALACVYRVLAGRRIRSGDTANLLGAVASLPLAVVVRAAMLRAGSYVMVSPKTKLAPPSLWGHNAEVAWGATRELFGAQPGPGASPAGTVVIFGYACLFLTVLGMLRVLWRWRRARRAEHVLFFAIAGNLAVYIVSTLPAPNSPHDIVAVLPSGAILGARALVPDRIISRVVAVVATGFALAAAIVPLAVAARQPPAPSPVAGLAAWLQAHGLKYGLGGYWDGSAVALASGGAVQVRPVHLSPQGYQVHVGNRVSWTGSSELAFYAWETNTLWFDPARHYANFAVFDLAGLDMISTGAAHLLGKPVSANIVGSFLVLIYHQNLLNDVTPAPLPPTS